MAWADHLGDHSDAYRSMQAIGPGHRLTRTGNSRDCRSQKRNATKSSHNACHDVSEKKIALGLDGGQFVRCSDDREKEDD